MKRTMTINITENAVNAICGEGTTKRCDFGFSVWFYCMPDEVYEKITAVAEEFEAEFHGALNFSDVTKEVNGILLQADTDFTDNIYIETAEEFYGTEHDYYTFS